MAPGGSNRPWAMPWSAPRGLRRGPGCPSRPVGGHGRRLDGRERLALGESLAKLPAGADAELGEHLVHVPLDGPGAEVEHRSDLRVGEPVTREPGDLVLLRSEVVASLVAALPHLLTRREQLASGALGERLHADRAQQVVCGSKLIARIDAAAFAAQPLAVEQVRPGQLGPERRATEPGDRLDVETLGGA